MCECPEVLVLLIRGEKVGSADMKRVWVRSQEDSELAVSFLT